MTWMMPLEARTSAVTTLDRFTNTFWPRTLIRTRLPLSVLIDERLTTRLAASRPEATWYSFCLDAAAGQPGACGS